MDRKKHFIKLLKVFRTKHAKDIKVDKLLLFGSYVRADYKKWSDLDLIIVSKNFKGIKKTRRAIKIYDYWKEKHPVDFICYTPAEFNKLKKGITIVSQAAKEGVEIK